MTTKIPAELSSTPGIADSSNATAITIDSSENVGIGLTSPQTTFGKSGTLDANGVIIGRGGLGNHQTDATALEYYNGVSRLRAYGASAGTGILAFNTGGGGDSTDTERMRINSGGTVTKPYQPAFWAFNDAMMTNVSTGYTDVNMGGDRYDIGGNFNNSNGQFTAPVTGKYYLEANIGLQNIPLNAAWLIIQIFTSNHSYNFSKPTLNWDDTSGGYIHTISCSTIADMDENDVAYVRFYQYAGTADTDIYGTSGNSYTYFCGYLLG